MECLLSLLVGLAILLLIEGGRDITKRIQEFDDPHKKQKLK